MKKSRFAIFFLCVILLVASLSAFTACNPEPEDKGPNPLVGYYVGYREGSPHFQLFLSIQEVTSMQDGKEHSYIYANVYIAEAEEDARKPEIRTSDTFAQFSVEGVSYDSLYIDSYPSTEGKELNLRAKFIVYQQLWTVDTRLFESDGRLILSNPDENKYHFKKVDISLDEWKTCAYELDENGNFVINGDTDRPEPYFYEENN